MQPTIDPNTFRLRIEPKINIIAHAVGWLLALAFTVAAYLTIRAVFSAWPIPEGWDIFLASAVGLLSKWLVIDQPMRRLEKRIPLFED